MGGQLQIVRGQHPLGEIGMVEYQTYLIDMPARRADRANAREQVR